MGTWRVRRQDDNGNIYLVAGALEESAARRLAAELEARAHKQLYFVDRERTEPDPGAADPI
jgi:hypothetical protein